MTLGRRVLARVGFFLALPGLALSPQARPQGLAGISLAAPSQVSGFPVTGRVVCADTQHPARFAQVMLIPAGNGTGDFDRGHMAIGRTDLDGRFTIDNVPAGDYFATAELTGYLNDAPAVRFALSQGGEALNTLAAVPRVQVSAGGASVPLSLQRGGVFAGTVQWDDGSPAAGVQVAAEPAPSSTGQGTAMPPSASPFAPPFNRLGAFGGFNGGSQTDDRGRFRLSGLAPGSYVLRASVQSPLPQAAPGDGRFPHLMTLAVYAPNKLRRTEAAVLALTLGEERADISVVLGLAGMHTVSGQVSSTAAPVRSGSVLLTDQTDGSLNRRANINADGTFTVPYVPPGTYTLRVTASSRAATSSRPNGTSDSDSAAGFQPAQESVTVADTDLSGLTVAVAVATASQ